MIRRQILFGITLVLLAVILFMLLRGHKMEKERAEQNTKKMGELVSASPVSVRAILPHDLEIVKATASWTRNPDDEGTVAAHHDLIIRNTGEASYVSLWLRMEYINEEKKPVEIRTYEVKKKLPSGETLHVSDIVIDGLPDAASDFRANILSADMEPPKN